MFNSTLLSIVITLAFIYLLVAIMVTGINETFFTLRRQKAKQLEKFLSNFFFDKEWKKIFSKFKDSPYIQVLKKDAESFPAAIPASIFAKTVIGIISDGKYDHKTLKSKVTNKPCEEKGGLFKLMDSWLAQYEKEDDAIGKIESNLENIFNNSMERLTGWYKRFAKILSFIIGLIICIMLNLDTINITNRLWKNKDQADKIASFAVDMTKNLGKDSTGTIVFKPTSGDQVVVQTKDSLVKTQVTIRKDSATADSVNMMVPLRMIERSYKVVSDSGIPMGWSKENVPDTSKGFWEGLVNWLLKILGILITAFAVALGAPFWFDLLTRITPLKKSAADGSASAPSPGQNK